PMVRSAGVRARSVEAAGVVIVRPADIDDVGKLLACRDNVVIPALRSAVSGALPCRRLRRAQIGKGGPTGLDEIASENMRCVGPIVAIPDIHAHVAVAENNDVEG